MTALVVYAKEPFAGPRAVLAYLSRYTHRVAISNSRLVAHDERGVTFRWKDYRDKGRTCHKTMTLSPEEFMRRFWLHVLPSGFHRIRHYGLLANNHRRACIERARQLLVTDGAVTEAETPASGGAEPQQPTFVCVIAVRRCTSLRRSHADSPFALRHRGDHRDHTD